jgi:hypothetical protein
MRSRQTVLAAASVAVAVALGAGSLGAAPRQLSAEPLPVAARSPARASLHVDVPRGSIWVGQAVPITVRAVFRDVERVTLEGVPQLESDAVFTADLGKEPRQATQVIEGEPRLVATWTGTLTPSTAGPLSLSVELPVRLRYHDAPAAPPAVDPGDGGFDPFDLDPMDPSSFERIFRAMDRSFAQRFMEPSGNVHDDATTLEAKVKPPLEVRPLPRAGQPRGFSGAVGQFELRAALPAGDARVSEPITLRFTLSGHGDLDRVQVPGVPDSADFKAYPPSVAADPGADGKKPATQTFEQVIVPLRAGQLTLPPVEVPVFDPVAGRYTTLATAPLSLVVQPSSAPAAASPSAALAPPPAPPQVLQPPRSGALRTLATALDSAAAFAEQRWLLALWLLPLAGLIALVALARRLPSRTSERSLRRAARRAARRGSGAVFFGAARRWIVVHFAKRWHVPEEEVTADALRARLGAGAEPLASTLVTADALRFGRRSVPSQELVEVCSAIETSLRARPNESYRPGGARV